MDATFDPRDRARTRAERLIALSALVAAVSLTFALGACSDDDDPPAPAPVPVEPAPPPPAAQATPSAEVIAAAQTALDPSVAETNPISGQPSAEAIANAQAALDAGTTSGAGSSSEIEANQLKLDASAVF